MADIIDGGRLEDRGTTEISFIPHPGALTNSGRSHFSRPADGLAEFIDNSIQACRDHASERSIKIGLYLDESTESGTGYLTICDNGCGMNADDLTNFATYSYDRKSRGLIECNETSISKFGVGAKQAGFYLGERLRIVTKCRDDDKVRELILDGNTLLDLWNNSEGGKAFTGNVNHRPVKHPDETIIPGDEKVVKPLQENMLVHETSNESFTIVVIKLHKHIVKNELLKDGKYMVILSSRSPSPPPPPPPCNTTL